MSNEKTYEVIENFVHTVEGQDNVQYNAGQTIKLDPNDTKTIGYIANGQIKEGVAGENKDVDAADAGQSTASDTAPAGDATAPTAPAEQAQA